MITLLLCNAGALKEPILYLSLYLKTHRQAYYDLLQRVREKGEWLPWIDFFITGVSETAEQAFNTSQEILGLFSRDRKKVEELGRPAGSALMLYQYLQQHPISSVPKAVEALSITTPTIRKSFKHLMDLGIVREITGKKRDRMYFYSEYIDILQRGTEPL